MTITVPQEFYIIDAPTRYNFILGRKFIVVITGIPSTHHQTLLFVGRDERVEGPEEIKKWLDLAIA